MGSSWTLGAIFGLREPILGHLGALLGPSWATLGPSWAILEPSWATLAGKPPHETPRAPTDPQLSKIGVAPRGALKTSKKSFLIS